MAFMAPLTLSDATAPGTREITSTIFPNQSSRWRSNNMVRPSAGPSRKTNSSTSWATRPKVTAWEICSLRPFLKCSPGDARPAEQSAGCHFRSDRERCPTERIEPQVDWLHSAHWAGYELYVHRRFVSNEQRRLEELSPGISERFP